MPYDTLETTDIVALELDGTPFPGERRKPSSEWPMHAALYRARSDIAAIVHGHSPAATAVACLGRELPAFHYMVAMAGGSNVRCAGYAMFGSEELAEAAVEAMQDRWACLLAHHGLLAAGHSLERALAVAREVEFLADIYLRLLPLGEPERLGAKRMGEVIERFRSYGEQE
jgi:L-fuculose-phosphate aldolase